MRCYSCFRVLWLPCRFPQDLNQIPISIVAAILQTSPDKDVNCPCATVSFTVPPEPEGFVMLCPLTLGVSAFYDISVRRLAGLPLASFKPSLAGTLLP
jgi:hypothetical protein